MLVLNDFKEGAICVFNNLQRPDGEVCALGRYVGRKEVIGLWIEQTEGAKFWLKVFNELNQEEASDGLQTIGRLNRLRPDVKIVVYSMIGSPPVIQDILSAGAAAFSRARTSGCR